MKKIFFLPLLFSLAIGADLRARSISEAQWLWSPPKSDPPMTAYLRREFSIDSPVKRAYFHTWADKRCEAFLNGKPLELRFWEPLRKYRGHVKGVGVEFSKLLKPGKNVLAFKLGRNKKGCFGLMLRGEIVLENGKVAAFGAPRDALAQLGANGSTFDMLPCAPKIYLGTGAFGVCPLGAQRSPRHPLQR